jgi:hypothetical protein
MVLQYMCVLLHHVPVLCKFVGRVPCCWNQIALPSSLHDADLDHTPFKSRTCQRQLRP